MPLAIADFGNAALDLAHIAAIATSPEDTATDREGNSKYTIHGAITAISAAATAGLTTISVDLAAGRAALESAKTAGLVSIAADLAEYQGDIDAAAASGLLSINTTTTAGLAAINAKVAQVEAAKNTAVNAAIPAAAAAVASTAAFNPRGPWATTTVYAQRDLVLQGGTWYACAVAHTSGTFATDLAAGRWAVREGVTVGNPAHLFVNQSTGWIGFGTTSPLAPIHVGGAAVNNSVDAMVLVTRSVDNTGSGNGHCFSDSSDISRSGTISYCPYDARGSFSGSANFGHLAAFQNGWVFNGSGTVDDIFTSYSGITANGQQILRNYGLYFANPVLTAGGNVAQNIVVAGANLPEYTGTPSSATTNYMLYNNGGARIWAAAQAGFSRLYIGPTEGTATKNVHVISPSGSAVAMRIQQQGYNTWDWTIPASQTYMQLLGNNGVRLTLLNTGTMGLGSAVPSASDIGQTFQLSSATLSAGSADTYWASNAVYNGAWKYLIDGAASHIANFSGQTRIYRAASGSAGGNISWLTSLTLDASGHLLPGADNTQNAGSGSLRFGTVYAGTGSINTSDLSTKQQVREIATAERAVARRILGLMRAYKFNDAVEAKGDGARTHFGVIAQDVKAAFEVEGLVAERYALLCYDEWAEQLEERNAAGVVLQEYRAAGNRWGVRYDELFAFVLGSLDLSSAAH